MTIDRSLGPACIVGRAPVWERVRQVVLLGAAAVLVSAGCEGKAITDPQQTEDSGFVSDPVLRGAPGGARTAVVSGEELVFVSLPSDSFPEGQSAVITNTRSGSTVTASMVNGGLDPVSLPATIGDEVVLDVLRGTGERLAQLTATVPKDSKPRIVRTSPARGKRDVPLNARIVIIFSEPIDGATLTAASIRLLRGTTSVAGTARFLHPSLDASQFSVEFIPDAPLAAETQYELVVTSAVRDQDGAALAASESVVFTTGNSFTGPPATISLSADTMPLAPGATHQVTATVRDAAGNTLTDHPITWSSSNPAVLTVSSSGLITAVDGGAAAVIATAGTVSRSLLIRVLPRPPASVTIEPATITVPAQDTILLSATVRDAEGRVTPAGVTWSTSDGSVVTLTNAGITTRAVGVKPGSATITAIATGINGTASGTASVTVGQAVPVASVTVAPEVAMLLGGQTVQLTATLRDATGRVIARPVTWTSNNSGVARVDAAGLVTGVGEGSATVTTTSEGASDVAAITVALIELASVSAGGAGGFGNSCGRVTGGAAYCWGDNSYGQLGDGSDSSSLFPRAVSGGHSFTGVSPGFMYACGVTTNGAAYCWGLNNLGQLGDGSGDNSSVPVAVAGGLTFATFTVATDHTCGLTSGGAAYCWGAGSTNASRVPLAVPGGVTFKSLSAKLSASHTCGVTTAGAAYCWGSNDRGQLGDGSAANSSVPVAVTGGLTFTALGAGYYHTCGVVTSGAAYCWGTNQYGQLGTGSTDSSPVPVAVAGGLTFTALTAGYDYTCGLATSGRVYCWGINQYGQLGTGSTNSSLVPVAVAGGLTFTSVTSGASHTCGLATSGGAYCWGENGYGQLGNGSRSSSPVPVRVAGQR
jgi:uncharacterized protein YjdB